MNGGGILRYMCMPAGLLLLRSSGLTSKGGIKFDYGDVNNSHKMFTACCVVGFSRAIYFKLEKMSLQGKCNEEKCTIMLYEDIVGG